MNKLIQDRPSQEITRSRRIGFLIYPGCEILDVCGPCDVFHWADVWLPRFGRADEPGYQCDILAATPGPVRTIWGIQVAATHSFHDIADGLDTLVVARMMVVFPRRPGGQSQFSAYIKLETKNRPDIEELQAWILGHPEEDVSVSALADRMAMSPRNFARLFRSETGETPAQFTERARADAARCKLEQTVVPLETIAEECGFGNAERMRRTFQRLFDVSPHDYRARFRSSPFN